MNKIVQSLLLIVYVGCLDISDKPISQLQTNEQTLSIREQIRLLLTRIWQSRFLSAPGEGCSQNSDCDSLIGANDGLCYHDQMISFLFPPGGYCTIDNGLGTVCDTNPMTPTPNCPFGSNCVSTNGYRLCLPACGPGDSCPTYQSCFTSFNSNPLDQKACIPGNSNALDGDACIGFYECNANSVCWVGVENPGGLCTAFACTVGTNAGCNGGECIVFEEGPSTGNVCVESCGITADCRSSEGYVCYDPDGIGGLNSYCRHPHAGDSCTTAADCGGSGWLCQTIGFPDGYCTASDCPTVGSTNGCGSGAICAFINGANACIDRCPTVGSSTTCRSGYTCVAVAPSGSGGCLPVSP